MANIGSFGKLQSAVNDAVGVIKGHFDNADCTEMFVQITASMSRYDELTVKYTVAKSKYGSEGAVTGNELAPTVQEFLRRNGWDIAHNAKLISAPVSNPVRNKSGAQTVS